jgi:hypothetical protein
MWLAPPGVVSIRVLDPDGREVHSAKVARAMRWPSPAADDVAVALAGTAGEPRKFIGNADSFRCRARRRPDC